MAYYKGLYNRAFGQRSLPVQKHGPNREILWPQPRSWFCATTQSESDSGRVVAPLCVCSFVFWVVSFPKTPCSFILHTWVLKGLPYHNFEVYVYTIKLHGAFWVCFKQPQATHLEDGSQGGWRLLQVLLTWLFLGRACYGKFRRSSELHILSPGRAVLQLI